MAEENNDLDFTKIGIAIGLWFLSSMIITQIRLFAKIPMGPQAVSASSCISCVVATFLMATGTGQNPVSLITGLFK